MPDKQRTVKKIQYHTDNNQLNICLYLRKPQNQTFYKGTHRGKFECLIMVCRFHPIFSLMLLVFVVIFRCCLHVVQRSLCVHFAVMETSKLKTRAEPLISMFHTFQSGFRQTWTLVVSYLLRNGKNDYPSSSEKLHNQIENFI